MRILITISILFILLFSAMLATAILIGAESEFTAEINIAAPEAVIQNRLLDFDGYSRWSQGIESSELKNDGQNRTVIYRLNDQQISVSERIVYESKKQQIVFIQDQPAQNTVISDLSHAVMWQPLQDGSTVVVWHVRYKIKPFSSRLVHFLFYRDNVEQFVQRFLYDLKASIIL